MDLMLPLAGGSILGNRTYGDKSLDGRTTTLCPRGAPNCIEGNSFVVQGPAAMTTSVAVMVSEVPSLV